MAAARLEPRQIGVRALRRCSGLYLLGIHLRHQAQQPEGPEAASANVSKLSSGPLAPPGS